VIAIDTNVLLRYLLCDDKAQSAKASKLINGSKLVLITDVVLTEAVWTLKGAKYKLDKDGIVSVINALFEEPNIRFEDGQTIWRSLNDFRKADSVKVGKKKKVADFPDVLIVNKSKYRARLSDESFEGLFTFDIAAQEIDGTRKP
jgi:predicted nucleic-acid-binding protein